MADSQKVRADSRLLWDNVHPALEAIVTNGVADVEFPDTTNGMKMAIDMSQVLKEICYDFDDLVFEFHLTDKPVRYFTGKADVAKEKAMHFYPVNCYSKRFDKSYFSVDIRKKDSSILSSECIEIEGVTMDPSEARVFEDWFLLQRLADRAPRPLAKESAINFVHPTYLTNQLQTCLYYYSSCSTQEPDKQSISSRLNIPASDEVYEFLRSAIEFQLKRRGIIISEGKPQKIPVQSYEPQTRKLKPFESAEQSYEPGWEKHQHYG